MLLLGKHLEGLKTPFNYSVIYLALLCDHYKLSGRVISGRRTIEEQAVLYAKGRTEEEIRNKVSKRGQGGTVTDAVPGASAHNHGLAIDVEGVDQLHILRLAESIGLQLVSWDPAHIQWRNWQLLANR